jgi:hypothetical protein
MVVGEIRNKVCRTAVDVKMRYQEKKSGNGEVVIYSHLPGHLVSSSTLDIQVARTPWD